MLQGVVIVFNTESVWHFFNNESYKSAVKEADYICVDGAVLKLVARLLGVSLSRYHGPDLLAQLEEYGYLSSSCVIGGGSMNQSLVDCGIISQWVELSYSDNEEILFEEVRANSDALSSSKVILISLGLPKQELLAHKLRIAGMCSNQGLIVPVGAAIDFLTGAKKRSALFWRRLGLEWLPRLIREPRMWKRNFRGIQGLVTLLLHEIKALR